MTDTEENLIAVWREKATFPSDVLSIPLPISLAYDSRFIGVPFSQNQKSDGEFWYVHKYFVDLVGNFQMYRYDAKHDALPQNVSAA